MLMALSYVGGENAQIEVGLPQAVTGVFQGLLLFFSVGVRFPGPLPGARPAPRHGVIRHATE